MSTEKFIQAIDESVLRNRILKNNEKIAVRGHSTALDIKHAMGNSFDEFKKIAIVRHPYSKMVSSYFFYKNGKPITEGNHNPYPVYLRMAFAKVMPFVLWSLLYPYKSNMGHLVDKKGNLLVDYIGSLENLSEDILSILQDKIGLDCTNSNFPHTNKSKHKDYTDYFRFPFHKRLIDWKIKKDLAFYKKVVSK
ncbi:MAG: hypothetical protein NXI23_21045 [Bacteroidetes bacterium]|nr:hypothetical protein [Bacteroidota bacterium]